MSFTINTESRIKCQCGNPKFWVFRDEERANILRLSCPQCGAITKLGFHEEAAMRSTQDKETAMPPRAMPPFTGEDETSG